MKIKIKSDETRLNIRFPTCLVLNRLGATVLSKTIKKKSEGRVRLSQKDITAVLRSLKTFRKKHTEYPLVEIQSNDGTEVLILL